jgi:SAM-dependent methyltransferase
LIAHARKRGQESGEPIQYDVADATDEDALAALGEGQFDAVVCTMALMDMPVIMPLYRAVRRLLRPEGRFVFATAHPAFNSSNPIFIGEMADEDGKLTVSFSVKISAYLDIQPTRATGAPGEPSPHYYYHRPLHELLGEAFGAGFVLDALEEVAFDGQADGCTLSWRNLRQIPPVMAGRLVPRRRP